MKKILLLLLVQTLAFANKIPTSMVNGTEDERHPIHAFTHATLYIDAQTKLDDATLIIQDKHVIDFGASPNIPPAAIRHDLKGAIIYPSFILLDSGYGLSAVGKRASFSFFGHENMDSTLTGALNTNEAIKASYQAINEFHHNKKQANKLRANGFGVVLSSKHDGIMRGTSVLVDLDEASDQQSIITQQQAFHLSFDKGTSKQLYPISLMGASALIRQTWLDAIWYGTSSVDFVDLDLKAINDNTKLPQIFHVSNWQQALLASKIALEHNKNIILRTAGDAYKHLDAIKKLKRPLIVPLNFPQAINLNDKMDAWNTSLEKMMAWEDAPYNLYFLQEKAVQFAIAPDTKGQKDFLKNLRKAVKKGLSTTTALAALTTVPAQLLSNSKIGNLKKGSMANFIITETDIFKKDSQIAENWVAGKKYKINGFSPIQAGTYQLSFADSNYMLKIKNTQGKITIKDSKKDSKIKFKVKTDNNFITLEIKNNKEQQNLYGLITDSKIGNIGGQQPLWQLKKITNANTKQEPKANDIIKQATNEEPYIPSIPQPFSAFGFNKAAQNQSYLIKNATVWTNEEDGILQQTDVYINHGKIKAIGKNLEQKADVTIDGSKQHLTAGIIDEHSHIALLSVNDIMANSSMVRMADSLNSDDINIYRNLAGGVTAAQLLHGSANPIGGQSAIIKMRWGKTNDELLIKGADKFIKFALGENVKRSRSQNSIRYPLTRMGVEQVYRNAFSQALDYEKQWATFKKTGKNLPRKDLMLDATLQVVKQQRYVTCHSYVQSEINMLMHVAQDFGFHINTFTHILEGYKVADKMLAHGAGASSFADWWAYKWEVNYAIPYNAAIMTKVGITTAINSDDPEMARRLNQEAAKSIKYGNLSEQQALKLVTLNPAKLLHLDKRMGSIKTGKDADIVLWSDNPTSIYAHANKTFVDGQLLFDRDQQAKIEKTISQQRNRIIKLMNNAKEPKIAAEKETEKHLQCDSITGYEYLQGTKK